jgi:hypothetical protein
MKKVILLQVMFISLSVGAQKMKFYDGFIVTKTSDTLKGLVHWKKYSHPTDNVSYKKTENEKPQQFSLEELDYVYNSDDKQGILIKTVRRSLEYIDPSDFNIKWVDSTDTETIPLTPLYIGRKISLYEFYDKVSYFFIYDGEKMTQLIQRYRYLTDIEKRFYFQRAPKYFTFNDYRALLSSYYNFNQDKKMKYLLDNSIYEERSLFTLISKMDKKLN